MFELLPAVFKTGKIEMINRVILKYCVLLCYRFVLNYSLIPDRQSTCSRDEGFRICSFFGGLNIQIISEVFFQQHFIKTTPFLFLNNH